MRPNPFGLFMGKIQRLTLSDTFGQGQYNTPIQPRNT